MTAVYVNWSGRLEYRLSTDDFPEYRDAGLVGPVTKKGAPEGVKLQLDLRGDVRPDKKEKAALELAHAAVKRLRG